MNNLAFFARPARFRHRTSYFNYPHLQSGSSLIRGEQIAEYLGAKYNPKEGYENDLCIYVKPWSLEWIKDGSYADLVDDYQRIESLFKYPEVGVIVCSQTSYEYLKEYIREKQLKNKLVFIPQQHCNFERILRNRKEITTVGIIGSIDSFNYPHDKFRKQMAEKGLKFITNHSFTNRQDVVDFYKQIDIQVSWNTATDKFKNPLRIVNAASFGIPTVAYPEVGFKEFEGNYIAVKTTDDLIAEVEKLKNEDYYNQWASKIVSQAEAYHISRIAEKYRQLL